MSSRSEAIQKHFCVSYSPAEGEVMLHYSRTQEENDAYAHTMEIMGCKGIIKSAYDTLTRKWNAYVKNGDTITYTTKI